MIRLLGPADYRVMPWKNGLGSTTELVRSPDAGESFDWRVSIADVVSDGPFSRFDGIDRVIITIEGSGMTLRHGAAVVTLKTLQPYAFAGELETYCSLLSGSIRDFNVMTRRQACQADVAVHRSSFVSAATLLYCVGGEAAVEARGEAFQLLPGEAFQTAGDASITAQLTGDTVVIAVSLTKR